MKYRIRKTNEIVDVVGYSACTHTRFPEDYVCYIDNKEEEIVGRGLNLIWDFEPINEESVNALNWQSFRAKAAKDILCAMIAKFGTSDIDMNDVVGWTDSLISKLKEKEEK